METKKGELKIESESDAKLKKMQEFVGVSLFGSVGGYPV